MILACLVALAADPAALRQVAGPGPLLDVGTGAIGVAAALGPVVLGGAYAYGANVSVHGGVRRSLTGDRPWGVDGFVSGGVAVSATPGVAVVGTGAVRAGRRDERSRATLGLVAPLALRLDVPELAVPLILELGLAAVVGPLWLGLRGEAGGTLATGGPPAGRASLGVFVQLPGRSRGGL